MKIFKFLPIGIVPVRLMGYGWSLGQLHQSGYDIAGIFLFVTGLIGLVLGIILYFLTQKYKWHVKWYTNALLGLAGCGIVFALVYLFARLHG